MVRHGNSALRAASSNMVRTQLDNDNRPSNSAAVLSIASCWGVIRTSSRAVRFIALLSIIWCPQWEQEASAIQGDVLAFELAVNTAKCSDVIVERRPVAGPVGFLQDDEQLRRPASQPLAWRQGSVVVALLEWSEPRWWTGTATTRRADVQVGATPVRLLSREPSEVFSQSSHAELSIRHSAVQGKRYG